MQQNKRGKGDMLHWSFGSQTLEHVKIFHSVSGTRAQSK